MSKKRITIIGTGCLGASLGLTLQEVIGDEVELVGHDKDPETSQQAKQLGAVDRVSFNLDRALQGAQIVIIAVPLAEMRGLLADMGRLLPADAELIITDTAPLKVPVLEWADELLPAGAHFIGGDPFPAPGQGGVEWARQHGVEHARADLLEDAVYTITARPADDDDAVKAVDNLARHAGAQVLYTTPLEHDVARLFTTALPELAATALLQATTSNPGWKDIRQAAGAEYAAATAPAAVDAASASLMALLGGETMLRGLDGLIEQLTALRALLAAQDEAEVNATLQAAAASREQWLSASRERDWLPQPAMPQMPGAFQQLGQLFFGRRKPLDR